MLISDNLEEKLRKLIEEELILAKNELDFEINKNKISEINT